MVLLFLDGVGIVLCWAIQRPPEEQEQLNAVKYALLAGKNLFLIFILVHIYIFSFLYSLNSFRFSSSIHSASLRPYYSWGLHHIILEAKESILFCLISQNTYHGDYKWQERKLRASKEGQTFGGRQVKTILVNLRVMSLSSEWTFS